MTEEEILEYLSNWDGPKFQEIIEHIKEMRQQITALHKTEDRLRSLAFDLERLRDSMNSLGISSRPSLNLGDIL